MRENFSRFRSEGLPLSLEVLNVIFHTNCFVTKKVTQVSLFSKMSSRFMRRPRSFRHTRESASWGDGQTKRAHQSVSHCGGKRGRTTSTISFLLERTLNATAALRVLSLEICTIDTLLDDTQTLHHSRNENSPPARNSVPIKRHHHQ